MREKIDLTAVISKVVAKALRDAELYIIPGYLAKAMKDVAVAESPTADEIRALREAWQQYRDDWDRVERERIEAGLPPTDLGKPL